MFVAVRVRGPAGVAGFAGFARGFAGFARGFATLPALPQRGGEASAAAKAAAQTALRNDWTRKEIQEVYDAPLIDLLFYGVRALKS